MSQHFRKFYSCSRGLSIVEVLVASGIFAILGMATLALTISQSRANKSLSQKMESLSVETGLKKLINEPNACTCMFKDIIWAPTQNGLELPALSSLKNGCLSGAGSNLIEAGQGVNMGQFSHLYVDTIKIQNISDVSESGNSKRMADLTVTYNSKGYQTLKDSRIQKIIFNLDNSNKVTSCSFTESDSTCVDLGGTWTNGQCVFPLSSGAMCTPGPIDFTLINQKCGGVPSTFSSLGNWKADVSRATPSGAIVTINRNVQGFISGKQAGCGSGMKVVCSGGQYEVNNCDPVTCTINGILGQTVYHYDINGNETIITNNNSGDG